MRTQNLLIRAIYIYRVQRYRTDCILDITSRENKSIQNRIKLNIVRVQRTRSACDYLDGETHRYRAERRFSPSRQTVERMDSHPSKGQNSTRSSRTSRSRPFSRDLKVMSTRYLRQFYCHVTSTPPPTRRESITRVSENERSDRHTRSRRGAASHRIIADASCGFVRE